MYLGTLISGDINKHCVSIEYIWGNIGVKKLKFYCKKSNMPCKFLRGEYDRQYFPNLFDAFVQSISGEWCSMKKELLETLSSGV